MALTVALVLSLLGGCTTAPGPAAAPDILFRTASSGGGSPLDGATVTGTLTAYVDASPSYLSVAFYLDDPTRQASPLFQATTSPFELDLDTTALPNGTHELTIVLTIGNGGNETKVVAQAGFAVENTGSTTTTAVQAFFYPWYGNPANDAGRPGTDSAGWRHWQQNNHTPPDDVGSNFYPELGPYSSTSATTLSQQMQWMADAGIGVAIVSWWGQGSWEDQDLPAVLSAAAAHGVKVAFHIEPYSGRTPSSVVADIAYLTSHYGSSPAFYRVSLPTTYGPSSAPRGVFYLFDVLSSGTLAQWKSAMDGLHNSANDAFVLGQRVSTNPIDDAHFDGVYTYDAYAVDPSSFLNYAPVVASSGGVFAPSVGPGYDERRAVAGSTRYVSRAGGQRYDTFWQDAIDSGAPWITITSFNEWHEGTQIEPAVSKTLSSYAYSDYVGAYGTTATDAPMAYLDRTRHWVDVFLGQTPPPPAPSVSVSIAPTSASLTTGGSTDFTATVSNATDTSVTWSVDGGSVSGSGTTVTYTAPGAAGSYHVTATSHADGSKSATATVNVSAPSGGGTTVTIAAAGDIACDPADGNYHGGDGSSSACHMKATSDLLVAIAPDRVLTLGDNQYEDGVLSAFRTSYDPTWGRLKGITEPSPGNHEYHTSGASGYFGYFGSAAGDPSKGYYSFDLGAWHLVSLNSNCGDAGGCGAGSPQEQWLRSDLAAHATACTLAYWHHPRYSSGNHGSNTSMTALWQALIDGGADVVLSGHDHDYERFAPQDAHGALDTAHGVVQFVVGTGGKTHYSIPSTIANSLAHDDNTYGVLKLTLKPTSYDWQFVPEAGKTYSDAGSASCH